MRNTGIAYTSAERTPTILPELAELLPPLSGEQSAALEKDLLQNGCYSPIIVNEDLVVVDGHNRQRICEQHDLPYKMAVFAFDDLLEAKQCGLTKRAFLVRLIEGQPVKALPSQEIKALRTEIHHIGNNINQIARSVNAGIAKPDDARHGLYMLDQVYELMYQVAKK